MIPCSIYLTVIRVSNSASYNQREGSKGKDKQQILSKVFRNSSYGSPSCEQKTTEKVFFQVKVCVIRKQLLLSHGKSGQTDKIFITYILLTFQMFSKIRNHVFWLFKGY